MLIAKIPPKGRLGRQMALLAISLLLCSGCDSKPPDQYLIEFVGSMPPPGSSQRVTAFERRLFRRPGESAEDTKVYLVEGGKKRWVVNASWLESHGYRFPDEVLTIPAEQLDGIPTGGPIQ